MGCFAAVHDLHACGCAGCVCGRCGAPSIVAFSGKRQFVELLNVGRGGRAAGKGGGGGGRGRSGAGGRGSGGSGGGEQTGRGGGNAKVASPSVPIGPQQPGTVALAMGWPLPASTEVWVLTSTSGAAAMRLEEREAPYAALARRLQQVPWPRGVVPACRGDGAGVGGDGGGGGIGGTAGAAGCGGGA